MRLNWKASMILGLVLIPVMLCLYGIWVRNRATRITRDVEAFVAGGETDEAFRRLLSSYGSSLRQVGSCMNERCLYELDVNNRLYSLLHLTPLTDLNLEFERGQKQTRRVIVNYSIGNRVFLHIQTDACAEKCTAFYINPWQQIIIEERWNGIVELQKNTLPDLRKAAFAVDADCLTKLGGCTDIAEMLPTIWARNSGTSLRCIVPNKTGEVIGMID